MSSSEKRWEVAAEADAEAVKLLSSALNLPVPCAYLLVSRGISEASIAERFLNPRLSDMSDPMSLPDMQKAADRIWQGIRSGERISVYGDYDADGVASTAIVVDALVSLGATVTPCLPDRHEQGYGLSLAGLDKCIAVADPSLIVTVDCGSCDREAIKAASGKGIDVVVTDHHELEGRESSPYALVNPKRGDDEDAKQLAGAGVAFKLCHALVKVGRAAGSEEAETLDLRRYLDRVTVATIADVVRLTGENRALVKYGLSLFDSGSICAGLRALADTARLKRPVTARQLAFGIAPRLNAAGRMGAPDDALKLLLADDAADAVSLAGRLDSLNTERRSIEKRILSDALAAVESEYDPTTDSAIIAAGRGWHAGVVGIVASRLVDRYRKPAVVISIDEDGVGRGSCRSVPALDLSAALEECSDSLVTYGGHAMAAGLTVEDSKLAEFRSKFLATCAARLQGKDMRPVQRIDTWIEPSDIDDHLCDTQKLLGPFGEGNPSPIWGMKGMRAVGEPRILKEAHLKMTLAAGTLQIDAIGFGMAETPVPDGPMDVAFELDRNSFRGYDSLQLKLKDIRPSQPAI